jgi:hypothetical protein
MNRPKKRHIRPRACNCGLSIAAAFLIGTVEVLGLLAAELHLRGEPWQFFVDIDRAGFLIAGLFALTWVVAVAVWHFAGIEHRWRMREDPHPPRTAGPAGDTGTGGVDGGADLRPPGQESPLRGAGSRP